MSEHQHCGCGCGHNHSHDHDPTGHEHPEDQSCHQDQAHIEDQTDSTDEDTIMTLTLDDGAEMECIVLTTFPVGTREYIALLPVKDADSEHGEVFLYRFSVTPEGEPSLENIEEDEEYLAVAETFDEMLEDGDC